MKLEVCDVARTYTDGNGHGIALSPTNFSVSRGEFVCFVGPSGCGKTTLLNIIAGLLPPTTGEVRIDAEVVTGPGRDRMMMFQESALFPWRTVLGNVLFGLEFLPHLARPERYEIARRFLALVGLAGFEKHFIHQLSGGMKQRVALARALAPNPELLLMDEPFAALDALTREQLYRDLQNICGKYRKTVCFVTHNAREAACLADRVFVFSARPGRIVATVKVDLPRPRDMNDPGTAHYAREIADALRNGTREEPCDVALSANS